MKNACSLLLVLLISVPLFAQHPVTIRNLWTRPQVHVYFSGYKVSFAIRDINKTLRLLNEIGDTVYGATCMLDTSKDYSCELYPGMHTEYHSAIQPLLQKGVGVYLLNGGHAVVENRKHKIMKNIIANFETIDTGYPVTVASFYDPDNHEMLFYGIIDVALIGRDMGIDD